jgi:hypothetical protein
MTTVITPQKAAYATSKLRTWRERYAITGSGDDRSIQELVKATSWDMVSLGPKSVSLLERAGIRGRGWASGGMDASSMAWLYELKRFNTREWKWSLVMGAVIMSY